MARRHDLRPQQLFAWPHQAREGRLALPAAELSFVPVVEPGTAEPPIAPGSKALLEALADLLLQALAREETEVDGQEGGDEPQDHA